jgi:hypothetical protein
VAVDFVVTTQINHEQYTFERGVVAATVGAIGGALGAGLISNLASAAGAFAGTMAGATYLVPTTAVSTVQTVTTVATGAVLSGGTNVALSSVQRNLNSALNGEDVTLESVQSDIQDHWVTDAFYGGASFALGYGAGEFINDRFIQFKPSVAKLLEINPTQRVVIGTLQGAATGLTNSSLLQTVFSPLTNPLLEPEAQ